jgi:hypothetical protein
MGWLPSGRASIISHEQPAPEGLTRNEIRVAVLNNRLYARLGRLQGAP